MTKNPKLFSSIHPTWILPIFSCMFHQRTLTYPFFQRASKPPNHILPYLPIHFPPGPTVTTDSACPIVYCSYHPSALNHLSFLVLPPLHIDFKNGGKCLQNPEGKGFGNQKEKYRKLLKKKTGS